MAEQITNRPKKKITPEDEAFIQPLDDVQTEPKKEKKKPAVDASVKKEKKKKKKENTGPSIFTKIIGDERTPKLGGLVLILTAVFLFVAFVSYLFTWKNDQNFVFHFSLGNLLHNNFEVDNKLGKLGAFISHFFIYNGYGVSSFLFVMMAAALGLNWLLRRNIFNIRKLIIASFFLLIIMSTAFAFVFSANEFPYGGAFGNLTSGWLMSFIGSVGTATLLVFIGLAWLVISFNINFMPDKKVVTENFGDEKVGGENISVANKMAGDVPLEINMEDSAFAEAMAENEEDSDEPFEPVLITKEIPQENNVEAGKEINLSTETPEEEIDDEEIFDNDLKLEVAEQIENPEEEIAEGEIIREPYDPTLELSDFEFPSLDFLENYSSSGAKVTQEELEQNSTQIVNTLKNYNISIDKIKATVGPTVTLYEIVPSAGVRISKIKNLEDDIALSLSALGIRIIAPIPGKGTIGIEVPNTNKEIVSMRSLLASEKFANSQMDLPVALGKTISNEIFIADLSKMPHLLMAGATGQGKSVGVNALLISLLYKKHPSQIKFVLIDPKKVELSLYSHIEKHYLAILPGEAEPIIVDTKKVIHTLKSLCMEMDARYDLLKDAQCRNIKEYNEKFIARKLLPTKGHKFLPYIVLVIDEFADLIMTAGKEVETPIARLAQLARAIGIHLIIATQRPSVNIITGVIKANFPARMAFKVSSKIDSRTILDTGGADQLIGRGDMLLSVNGDIVRLQCPFVDTPEVDRIVDFIGKQRGYPQAHQLPEVKDEDSDGGDGDFNPNEKDELFDEAAHLIVMHQQGSTSLIQRRMKLGYNRAGRLMDQLEAAGVVGPNLGSKAREVLFKSEDELDRFLDNMKDIS